MGGIDAWGAVFTGTTTTVEMNATGSKLRPVTRVGEFVNVPELVTMSSVYTDSVTREQVSHSGRIPELETGARQVISKQATQEVRGLHHRPGVAGSALRPQATRLRQLVEGVGRRPERVDGRTDRQPG